MISVWCVARNLHTVAPGPLERTFWRQFAALWGDCKKSRIAPLNAIIIIIIIVIIILYPVSWWSSASRRQSGELQVMSWMPSTECLVQKLIQCTNLIKIAVKTQHLQAFKKRVVVLGHFKMLTQGSQSPLELQCGDPETVSMEQPQGALLLGRHWNHCDQFPLSFLLLLHSPIIINKIKLSLGSPFWVRFLRMWSFVIQPLRESHSDYVNGTCWMCFWCWHSFV